MTKIIFTQKKMAQNIRGDLNFSWRVYLLSSHLLYPPNIRSLHANFWQGVFSQHYPTRMWFGSDIIQIWSESKIVIKNFTPNPTCPNPFDVIRIRKIGCRWSTWEEWGWKQKFPQLTKSQDSQLKPTNSPSLCIHRCSQVTSELPKLFPLELFSVAALVISQSSLSSIAAFRRLAGASMAASSVAGSAIAALKSAVTSPQHSGDLKTPLIRNNFSPIGGRLRSIQLQHSFNSNCGPWSSFASSGIDFIPFFDVFFLVLRYINHCMNTNVRITMYKHSWTSPLVVHGSIPRRSFTPLCIDSVQLVMNRNLVAVITNLEIGQ